MLSIRLKGVTFRSVGRGVRGVLAWKEAGRRLMPAGELLGARGEPEEDKMGDKDPTEPRPDPRPVTLLLRSSRSCLCGDGAGGGMTQACCCSLMAMIFSCCWAKRCISVCRKLSDVFSLSMERVYSARSTSPEATPVLQRTKIGQSINNQLNQKPQNFSTYFLFLSEKLNKNKMFRRFLTWLKMPNIS